MVLHTRKPIQSRVIKKIQIMNCGVEDMPHLNC